MPVSTTVLFASPQREIASLIEDRLDRSVESSIVVGFATPGGMDLVGAPIRRRPASLKCLIIGAATFPAFEMMDELVGVGVPQDRVFVHLGHTFKTGTPKNPFARFHPMLHSKIYYMELEGGQACAFIGSHNATVFALGGMNGEVSVMLEGDRNEPQFRQIRQHIDEARDQATTYDSSLKDAYAWWWREYLDGLRAEVKIPSDWQIKRTILIFAQAAPQDRPRNNEAVYFELPAGIQIDNLKTEVHVFLFNNLPPDPKAALASRNAADASYMCQTLGADNERGNRMLAADWHIDNATRPTLIYVPSGTFSPSTNPNMQQVRAKVTAYGSGGLDYAFERQRGGWDPVFSEQLAANTELPTLLSEKARLEAHAGRSGPPHWMLVKGLSPREGEAFERDEKALRLAAPDSGSFVLVSLRQRRMT